MLNEEDEGQEDLISKLPNDIIHEIFRFMPIRSVAQTMILSHRWKKVFSSIPDLDFTTISPPLPYSDHVFVDDYPETPEPPADVRDINFLENILSIRDNKTFSIRTLKLTSSQISCMVFDFLIKYPEFIDINELEVNLMSKSYFNIPWSIILGVRVLKLNIYYCNFINFNDLNNPSLIKREFKFLHTMTLYNLSSPKLHDKHMFTDSLFPCLKKLTMKYCYCMIELTLRCSELTDLVIWRCGYLQGLDIYGLKLERLKVKECFVCKFREETKLKIIAPGMKILKWVINKSFHIPYFPEKLYLLEKAVIGITISSRLNNKIMHSLSNMMSALSHAKFLSFKYDSIELFSKYDVISANKFENLRTLKINIVIEDSYLNEYNLSAPIANLFKSSPYLDTLVITNINTFPRWDECKMDEIDGKYWEEQLFEMNSFLNHIRKVKLVGFFECYEDISLAKFLLNNGKVLEEMVLCHTPNTGIRRSIGMARAKLIKSALLKYCPTSFSKARFIF